MKLRLSTPLLIAAALMTGSAALAEGNPPPGNAGGRQGVGPAPATGPSYGASASSGGVVSSVDATPLVVVAPAFFVNDPNLANGCWVRLYDKRDFKGTVLPLVGPVDIANNSPGYITGFEAGRNFDSAQLGPRASLTVWEKPKYEGKKSATLSAGQSLPNLNDRLGDIKEIRSMRVTCTP